jgi:predicted ATP-grasp superfamily ATP-dependent carboligase
MSGYYLVIAESGRALTVAARRAGVAVRCLDAFADLDTRAAAVTERLDPLAPGPILARVASLRRAGGLLGICYGGGLEGVPEVLAELDAGGGLLGTPPAAFALVNDPARFFALLDTLAVPHPRVVLPEGPGPERTAPGLAGTALSGLERQVPVGQDLTPPGRRLTERWLVKRGGSSGGRGCRPWAGPPPRTGLASPGPLLPGEYLQRHRAGRSASVVLLADGQRALIVGYNRHLGQRHLGQSGGHTQAGPRSPSRPYLRLGECAWPAPPAAIRAQVAGIAARLVPALRLTGLVGLDFLVTAAGRVLVLEVNARPPASFPLHEPPLVAPGLFAAHLAACAGRLPAAIPAPVAIRAQAILYAPCLAIPVDSGGASGGASWIAPEPADWPEWLADRPPPGTAFAPGAPVCTCLAVAADEAGARRSIRARLRQAGQLLAIGPGAG